MPHRYTTWDSYFLPHPAQPEHERVLRNTVGATTAEQLAERELLITLPRVAHLEAEPHDGLFDFAHHQQIHRRIFGEVYEWAGQPRTVDMGKTHRLCPAHLIESMAADVYGAIGKENNLVGLGREPFVERLAEHWGEVNVVHAFREGNTRSQRVFFAQLCRNAGYDLRGAYLEAHYREFNLARESAMLTARSDQFAEFLSHAVTTSPHDDEPPPPARSGPPTRRAAPSPDPGADPTARRHQLPGRGQWGFPTPPQQVLDAAAARPPPAAHHSTGPGHGWSPSPAVELGR